MQNQLEDIKKRLEHLEIENARLRREKVISNDKARQSLRQHENLHPDPAAGIGHIGSSGVGGPIGGGVQRRQGHTGFGIQPIRSLTQQPQDNDDEHLLRQHYRDSLALDIPSLEPGTTRRHILTAGRNIWVGSEHKSLQVSYELLGAALPDAIRGFPVTIFAKYEANVNTAVKGAAIAAERLREQGRYVAVEALFRDNRNELTLRVIDVPELTALYDQNKTSMTDRGALTVASVTDYKVLGGAIAMRVRDNKPTLLRAIGKRAVWAATRALAVAREYIVDDVNVAARTLVFAPKFNSVQLSNRPEPSTVVELYVMCSTQLAIRRASYGDAPRTHHTPMILPENRSKLF